MASPTKVILQEGSINSLVKYTNSKSTMKMRRKMSMGTFGSNMYATSEKTNELLKLSRTYTHSKPSTKALKLNEL